MVVKDFLPPVLEESVKLIKELQLRTIIRKVVNVEGIVPLFICIGDLHVHNRFGTVKYLAVSILLRT